MVKPSYVNCRGGQVDILMLGEAPGPEEAKKGRAFVGESGKLLRDLIKIHFPTARIRLDNICPEYLGRTYTGDFVKPRVPECKPYIQEVLNKCQPSYVMALGAFAARAMGHHGSITATSGYAFDKNGYTVVVSPHPAWVLRTGGNSLDHLRASFNVVEKQLYGNTKITQVIRELPPQQFLRWLDRHRRCTTAIDIETTALNPTEGRIRTIAAALRPEPGSAVVACYTVVDSTLDNYIWQWLCNGALRVMHNAKFEWRWFLAFISAELRRKARVADTMLMAGLYDENMPKSLKHLSMALLDEAPYWTALEAAVEQQGWDGVDVHLLGIYNANDAVNTLKLYELFAGKLTPQQKDLLMNVLGPLTITLARMETVGIAVHTGKLNALEDTARKDLLAETQHIQQTLGVNPRSTKQLRQLCFEKFNLQPVAKTAKGNPSVNQATLQILAQKEPRLQPLVGLRNLDSFVNRELKGIRAATTEGVCRTNYNLGLTVTGRLSSSSPNLQNIKRDSAIRSCFCSHWDEGVFLIGDYDQHELRVLAGASGDEKLLSVFKSGRDPHSQTAKALGIDRFQAKTVNFGIVYGIGREALAKQLKVHETAAARMIGHWFEEYAGVLKYQRELVKKGEKDGYVEDMFGRRRHMVGKDMASRQKMVNFPIQSAAATIVYMAMLRLEKSLELKFARMVHQIHDSIVVDCQSSLKKVAEVEDIMRRDMLQFPLLNIPLSVTIKAGDHW